MKRFNLLICVFSLLFISFPGKSFASITPSPEYDPISSSDDINLTEKLSDIELVEKYTEVISTEEEFELLIAYQTGTLKEDFYSPKYQRFITNYQATVSSVLDELQDSLSALLSGFSWLCPEDPEEIKELGKKLLELRNQLIKLQNGGVTGTLIAAAIRSKIHILEIKISSLQAQIESIKNQIENLVSRNDPSLQGQIDQLNSQAAALISEMLAAIAEKNTLEMALNESHRKRMIESIETILRFLSNCLKEQKLSKQEITVS